MDYGRSMGLTTIKIKIDGMTSLNCALSVQRKLSAVPTVKYVGVGIDEATVEHENASIEQLLNAIQLAGPFVGKVKNREITTVILPKINSASFNKPLPECFKRTALLLKAVGFVQIAIFFPIRLCSMHML